MTSETRRVVVVDSPEIAERGPVLFLGARTIYANGSLPADALDATDAVIVSTDRERIEQFCAAFAAVQCAKVRFWEQDLSGFTERQQVLDAAGGIQIYVSAPESGEAATLSGRPPPPESGSGAEPVENLTAQVSSHNDTDETGGAANPAAVRPAQDAPEPPQDEQIPLEAYADTPSAKKPPKQRKRPRLAAVDGNLARAPDPEDEPLPASLSEDALSEHFVETRGERWRYVPEWGVWLEWRGDGWHRDTLNTVTHACKEITRECLQWSDARTLTADGKRKISSKRMAWNTRDMAATHPKITILASELDADPMLLGVPGGCVDLKTGKFLEADPNDYITRRTSVAPEEGPHPLFDRVLSRAESEHDGMREYLIRALGYCLTGRTNEEVFFYLAGLGGSGKGTLTGALQAIWGDYADTIAMDALIETKQVRHTQEIAKLEGMRLVLASESEEGRRFNESLIKWLTGGDAITAHRMRMDDHTFKPTFKLLLSGNSVPHLKSVSDGAMKRRVHLIEYAAPIAEEDRDSTLKARLVEEYPAILATLIRGCVDWIDCHGLGKPESVTASVESYLEGEDSFLAFIEENVQRDASAIEQSSAVYRRYAAWARNAGEYVMSQKRFVQTLRQRGFDTKRTTQGRVISGLRLLPEPPQGPTDERPHWQRGE